MATALERAEQVQKERAAAFDRIRQDVNLSPVGRQRRLHEVHETTAAKLAQARADHHEARAAEGRRLTLAAFGKPAGVTMADYRAALSAADAVDSPRAAELALERCERIGDTLAGRAIGLVASEKGYASAITLYAQMFGAGDQLAALEAHNAEGRDVGRRLGDDMVFSGSPPAELAGYRPEPTEAAPAWRP